MKRLRDYTDSEMKYMPLEKVRLVFPEKKHEKVFLNYSRGGSQSDRRRFVTDRIDQLGVLRTCDCIAKFHVFPTSEDDVKENELLWSIVHNMKIDTEATSKLLGKKVLVMTFPNALYEYLSICTPEEMKQSILDIVSDVVDHPDSLASGILLENLAPSVFQDLNDYVFRRETGEIEPLKQTFLLDDILGHKFDQITSAKEVDLWNIDVRGAYLIDEDLESIFQENAEWDTKNLPPKTVANVAYHQLYRDWRTYCDLGFSLETREESLVLTEAIVGNISERKQESLAKSIDVVREIAKNETSLFSKLPNELVGEVIRKLALGSVDPTNLNFVFESDTPLARSQPIREFLADESTESPLCCAGCQHREPSQLQETITLR